MIKTFKKSFSGSSIWILVALALVATAIPVCAQVGSATISGRVTDPSGAAIVGSAIQVKNVDTNVVFTSVTNNQGQYRVPDLPIGNYEVQASMARFQTTVHKNIKLTVGSNPVVDFSLALGQASETITVESEVSRVETQTAAISTLVTSEQMRDLPLNGRNYSELITLAPGVQIVPPQAGVAGTAFYGAQENYSIAGARPEGQAFLMDNSDMVNFWNHAAGSSGTGYSLGVESIAEFQLLTNTYSAQFGGAGAVINAATKSGTNGLHGSGYEFLRNSALDARNYFDVNADGSEKAKPTFRRNQFGFSIGGPIVKDKLFFFGNYEGARDSTGMNVATAVPMPYVAQGKLPCSMVFESCEVPSALVDVPNVVPTSKAIAALFPAPLAGSVDLGGYASYSSVGNLITRQDYVVGRVDYSISTSDYLFGRYIYDKGRRTNPFDGSAIPGWPSQADSMNQFFTTEEKHYFSPQMLNLIRFTFSRTNERSRTTSTQPADNPLQFYPGRIDGNVAIQGVMGIGGNQALPYYIVQNKFGVGDDFMWNKGAHNLRIGAQVTRVQTNLDAPFELGGSYNFPTILSFLQGSPLTFLGVYPGQTDSTRDFREIDIAPYIQDDWKISPRLTVNLGVRWEFATNAVGVRHPLNNILNPPYGGFVPVEHVFAKNPNLRNFDPRIGIAFDPFSDHKTSIRAGFGIFHNRVAPRTYASGYYFSPPFANVFYAAFIPPFAPPPYPNSFPPPLNAPGTGPITQFAGVSYQIDRAPYMMQYNLNIQREIAPGTILSIGYLGSRGRNLFTQNDVNPTKCNTPGTALGSTPTTDCNHPDVNFSNGAGFPLEKINPANNSMFTVLGNSHSNYNSLQISLTRQMARNIAGQISYTYGKSLDNGSVSSGLEQFSFPRANPYNPDYDYGRSSFDVRHNISQNSLISLPFKGNKFVEGWQISEILSVASGMPVNVLNGFDNTGLGAAISAARPDYSNAAGCSPNRKINRPATNSAIPGAIQWFDPACYAVNDFGTLGNVPRDSVDAPGMFELDMTVKKLTKINERVGAEFRAEFFNILNHPMLAPPAAGIFTDANTRNANAGQITATSRPNRQMQFALKLVF